METKLIKIMFTSKRKNMKSHALRFLLFTTLVVIFYAFWIGFWQWYWVLKYFICSSIPIFTQRHLVGYFICYFVLALDGIFYIFSSDYSPYKLWSFLLWPHSSKVERWVCSEIQMQFLLWLKIPLWGDLIIAVSM